MKKIDVAYKRVSMLNPERAISPKSFEFGYIEGKKEPEEENRIMKDALEGLSGYTATTFKIDSRYVNDLCNRVLQQIKETDR